MKIFLIFLLINFIFTLGLQIQYHKIKKGEYKGNFIASCSLGYEYCLDIVDNHVKNQIEAGELCTQIANEFGVKEYTVSIEKTCKEKDENFEHY